jgi:hypothetical protein
MQMRTPSGSAIHISSSPTAPASAPAGSARHPRLAPVAPPPARAPAATTPCLVLAARRRGPTAPGTRRLGRRPCPGPARCRTRGRWPAPVCRGRRPGYARGRLGAAARGCSIRPWRHDLPVDPPGRNPCSKPLEELWFNPAGPLQQSRSVCGQASDRAKASMRSTRPASRWWQIPVALADPGMVDWFWVAIVVVNRVAEAHRRPMVSPSE